MGATDSADAADGDLSGSPILCDNLQIQALQRL